MRRRPFANYTHRSGSSPRRLLSEGHRDEGTMHPPTEPAGTSTRPGSRRFCNTRCGPSGSWSRAPARVLFRLLVVPSSRQDRLRELARDVAAGGGGSRADGARARAARPGDPRGGGGSSCGACGVVNRGSPRAASRARDGARPGGDLARASDRGCNRARCGRDVGAGDPRAGAPAADTARGWPISIGRASCTSASDT